MEAVFCPDEHQPVAVEADHVGGVMADLAKPGAKPDAAGRVRFVMGLRSLVSGRRWPVENPDAVRATAEKGRPYPRPCSIQAKLDELIRAGAAHNSYIGIEHLTEDELDELHLRCETRGKAERLDDAMDAADEAEDRAREKAARAAQRANEA